jgi:pimeloyl-ACP methyl ester carboxylesterase
MARTTAALVQIAEAADGMPILARDEGSGPVTTIIVHGGLDDGRSYGRLAARLASGSRVLRIVRRRYGDERSRNMDIADEAADVVALARDTDGPCYLFGHSSGGVVALEAAAAAPECFKAVAVFEPAIDLVDLPLSDPASTHAAHQALDAGHTGVALEIFLRDIVGVPRAAAILGRLLALVPRFRDQLIPGQIADQEALQRLGDRTTAYRGILMHVLLLTGAKSPEHLRRRSELLASELRNSDLQRLDGAGHNGPLRRSEAVAKLLLSDIHSHIMD